MRKILLEMPPMSRVTYFDIVALVYLERVGEIERDKLVEEVLRKHGIYVDVDELARMRLVEIKRNGKVRLSDGGKIVLKNVRYLLSAGSE